MNLERKILSRLVDSPEDIARVYDLGLDPKVFEEPLNGNIFKFIVDYWLKSDKQKAPTALVMETRWPGFNKRYEEIVEEESWWLAGELNKRFAYNDLNETLITGAEMAQEDPVKAWDWLLEQAGKTRDLVGRPTDGTYLQLLSVGDITDDAPVWAWQYQGHGAIQLGTLGLLAGRPGAGKSTAARWFAAQFSQGKLGGYWKGQPQNVAYIAPAEESMKYVIKPGLRAAGADLERIFFPEVINDGKVGRLQSARDENSLCIPSPRIIASASALLVAPVAWIAVMITGSH